MLPLSPGELARFRNTQEGAMMDTCTIETTTLVVDSFGQPLPSGSQVVYTGACGFNPGGRAYGGTEKAGQNRTLVESLPTLRLPIGAPAGNDYIVTITHKNGEALTPPLVFEMSGPVKRGVSGLVVSLRSVEVER